MNATCHFNLGDMFVPAKEENKTSSTVNGTNLYRQFVNKVENNPPRSFAPKNGNR